MNQIRIPLPRTCASSFILALLGLLFLYPVPARSQDWQDQCEITIREIVADNSETGVAAELEDLEKDLKKLAYSAYRLEHTYCRTVLKGETRKFDLMGDNHVELTLDGYEEGKIRLKVKISTGESGKRAFQSTMRIAEGGTFLIAGPSYMEGVLILAFTAKL
jgi:hypothetical protein